MPSSLDLDLARTCSPPCHRRRRSQGRLRATRSCPGGAPSSPSSSTPSGSSWEAIKTRHRVVFPPRPSHLVDECDASGQPRAFRPCPRASPTPRPTLLLPSSTMVLTTPLSCQSNQMLEPRIQTPLSTTTPTTPEVPTTTCCPLATTRSSLGGSQTGGLRLFRSVSQFVLAFLRQTCLTYVCTQILLLPLTRL
ncbi:hypothetical protein VPH35_083402 [Triticum aestivum]